MPKLPRISRRDAVRAFGKAGFESAGSRGKGSHIILVRDEPRRMLGVPNHKEIAPGTLRTLIRDADLTVEPFVELL